MRVSVDRIRLNPAGLRALYKSQGVRSFLTYEAGALAQTARSIAPVDTGDYARSITSYIVDHPTRAIGRVEAKINYGLVVEANHGTLVRALGAY